MASDLQTSAGVDESTGVFRPFFAVGFASAQRVVALSGALDELVDPPDIVIMDEATSALDELSQERMMQFLREDLAVVTVISVGHRPGLEAYHRTINPGAPARPTTCDAANGTAGLRKPAFLAELDLARQAMAGA